MLDMTGKPLQDYSLPVLIWEQEDATTNSRSLRRLVYYAVTASVVSGSGQIFFLDTPREIKKPLFISLLLSRVRRDRKIVIPVASSGIVATAEKW